jgi:hypothetical protein
MTEQKQFAIGERVAVRPTRHDNHTLRGSVMNTVPNFPEHLLVEWDIQYGERKSRIEKVSVKLLVSEMDAEQEQLRLDVEFAHLESQVKDKLEVAAAALDEASKIASSHGEELHQLHEAIYPLMKAMDRAGWNTSSLGC